MVPIREIPEATMALELKDLWVPGGLTKLLAVPIN